MNSRDEDILPTGAKIVNVPARGVVVSEGEAGISPSLRCSGCTRMPLLMRVYITRQTGCDAYTNAISELARRVLGASKCSVRGRE